MIHIIGGGTFSHVRNHLALATPAFGTTARFIYNEFLQALHREGHPDPDLDLKLHLTKMADSASNLVTNKDVSALLDTLIADPETRVIILNAALCDYDGKVIEQRHGEDVLTASGSHATRLKTRDGIQTLGLIPANKLVGKIRKTRKDIFAVGFKTTTNATPDEQYLAALNLLKANSLNLVLANDTVTRHNMIVAPEETRYHETDDRQEVLKGLVKIVLARMNNTFTRSTVVGTEEADTVPWSDPRIPDNLREVVNHCIERGAYKRFRGVTAGHFAVRLSPTSILTSKRKRDFNDLANVGLVQVDYEGRDKVIAHGAKPSVGGQSQRIIFDEHPNLDCIVHAHVPLKANPRDDVPVAPQWQNECGSHACGENTSHNLRDFADLKAVMLDGHGPNIVFSRDTPAETVIDFIEANFDLEKKTGGLVCA